MDPPILWVGQQLVGRCLTVASYAVLPDDRIGHRYAVCFSLRHLFRNSLKPLPILFLPDRENVHCQKNLKTCASLCDGTPMVMILKVLEIITGYRSLRTDSRIVFAP